ncbi:hypothetical protein IFHNHDMJ_02900 [Synechococcus sp. CBW1107]|nr:hypothetical protein IFHNHDMJ_02900 [Synechococcus sp. CBW1107]
MEPSQPKRKWNVGGSCPAAVANANPAADDGGYDPEAIKAGILAEVSDLKETAQSFGFQAIKDGTWFAKFMQSCLSSYDRKVMEKGGAAYLRGKYPGLPTDAIAGKLCELAEKYAAVAGDLSGAEASAEGRDGNQGLWAESGASSAGAPDPWQYPGNPGSGKNGAWSTHRQTDHSEGDHQNSGADRGHRDLSGLELCHHPDDGYTGAAWRSGDSSPTGKRLNTCKGRSERMNRRKWQCWKS